MIDSYDSINRKRKKVEKAMRTHFQELELFLTSESERGATDKNSEVADLITWHNLLDDLFMEVDLREKKPSPAVTGLEASSNKIST